MKFFTKSDNPDTTLGVAERLAYGKCHLWLASFGMREKELERMREELIRRKKGEQA